MKLLLDHQIFVQEFGGISRYYTELFRVLKTKKGVAISFPLLASKNAYLLQYNLQHQYFPFFLLFRVLNKLFLKYNLGEKNNDLINFLLKRRKYDVFIPTYYDTYFLPSIGHTPFVLTVYDMIHELFPQYFTGDQPIIRAKKLLIERATHIIAISENTKKDILKLYPHINESKIDVVYLSHSVKRIEESAVPERLNKRYILFVGHRHVYKNFVFFIKAAAPWLLVNTISLCCIGGGSFSIEEQYLLTELGLTHLVWQTAGKEEDMGMYYSHALAFVYPSEYEGFGIPVLEAMHCGCPVILPHASSFPEVAGDAGIYFELGNVNSLRDSLTRIVTEEPWRKEKIKQGYEQEKKFTWLATAEGCLEVYRKVNEKVS